MSGLVARVAASRPRGYRRRLGAGISLGYLGLLVPNFILWASSELVRGASFVAIPSIVATVTAARIVSTV